MRLLRLRADAEWLICENRTRPWFRLSLRWAGQQATIFRISSAFFQEDSSLVDVLGLENFFNYILLACT